MWASGLAGSAELVLDGGVRLLPPEPGVFDALCMLIGALLAIAAGHMAANTLISLLNL